MTRSFVDLTERIIYLRSIPVAAMLPPAILKIIASALRERVFPRGAMLMREGEPIEGLHLLTEGKVSLVKSGKPFGTLSPPQSLGFLGILARTDGTYDATADLDTRSLELDADTLIELIEDHGELMQATLRYLAERLLYEIMELPAEALSTRLDGQPRDLPEGRALDVVERVVYLRGLPVFTSCNLNALAGMSRKLTEVRFPAGARIWAEAEPAARSLLIMSGFARCSNDGGAKQWRAGPTSALGGLESIAEKPRWYEAVAETPVGGFFLPNDALVDLLEDDFTMAGAFIAVFAADLMGLMAKKAAAGQSTVNVLRDVTKLGAVPVGA